MTQDDLSVLENIQLELSTDLTMRMLSPYSLFLVTVEVMHIVHCLYPDYNDQSDYSDHSDVITIRDNETEFRERERRSFYRSGASLGESMIMMSDDNSDNTRPGDLQDPGLSPVRVWLQQAGQA